MPLHVLPSLFQHGLRVCEQGVLTVRDDHDYRHGSLGRRESRTVGSWTLNSRTDRMRWEHRPLAATSAGPSSTTTSLAWKAYESSMELCVQCCQLHRKTDPPGPCPAGHAKLSQAERDRRNEAQRGQKAGQSPRKESPGGSPASMKAHISVADACWVLAEQLDDDHPAYYAVSLTAYADEQVLRRGRGSHSKGYAIVSVRTPPSRPHRQQGSGILYECSRAACRTVAYQRLASHPDRVEPCAHVGVVQLQMQLRRKGSPPPASLSLDGCFAHIATGASGMPLPAGLRECMPCGISKEDIAAEHGEEPELAAQTAQVKAPVPWFVPHGFHVQETPPPARWLTFGNMDGDNLVHRHLLYNWKGVTLPSDRTQNAPLRLCTRPHASLSEVLSPRRSALCSSAGTMVSSMCATRTPQT